MRRPIAVGLGCVSAGLLGLATACSGASTASQTTAPTSIPAPVVAPTVAPVPTNGVSEVQVQATPVAAAVVATPQAANVAVKSSYDNPIQAVAPLASMQASLGWAGVAFIGGGEANKLWIADARNHKLVDSIEVSGPMVDRTDPRRYPNLRDAHAITFTKDFKKLYTVDSFDYEQSWVVQYDPTTLKEVARTPAGIGGHHLALSPNDQFLYVGNEYDTNVSVIDTASMRKIKDIEVGSGPDYISPSMYWDGKAIDSPYLWVSVDKDNQIVAIDWRKNEVAKVFPMDGSIHGINLTPDGKTVWAAVIGSNQIAVIDVDSLTITHTIDVPANPVHIVFSPDGKWAYTTLGGTMLVQFNTKTYEPGWVSAAGGAHLGVTPDGKEIWTLAHTFDQGDRYPFTLAGGPLSNAKVVDAQTGQFIFEMPFEYRPHEIQFVPYSAVGVPKVTSVVAAQTQADATPAAGAHELKVTATYDTFQPGTVTAKAGEDVQFDIVNQDDHAHDFVGVGDTPGNINSDVPPNALTTIKWTAPQASGRYRFECDIHPGQTLTVVVP